MECPEAPAVVTSLETPARTARMSRRLQCVVVSASKVACFKPMQVWPLPGGGVAFAPGLSYPGAKPMNIACGQCMGCRLDKAREWATRMTHEASLHCENSFVTLTYDDLHLPADGSLSVRATQLFMKRLRKALEPKRIRFFTTGEYGDTTWRPHYHAIIFGHDFSDDRFLWETGKTGMPYYRSPLLERLWPWGHSRIGQVNTQSAGYVARYALKKITGKERAADHYVRPHPLTGELFKVIPEFARMSTSPGIGAGWLDKYRSDCFPSGFVVIDGEKRPVPKYYVARASLSERESLKRLVAAKRNARAHAADNTPERLEQREALQQYRQAKLGREPTKE